MEMMSACSRSLRAMGRGTASMEEAAELMVRHLYEGLRMGKNGPPAAALVRFFKTHAYGALTPELREFADGLSGGSSMDPETKCLTLLASAGEEPAWNSRHQSGGHRAIPLLSEEAVLRAPMIARLIQTLGLPVSEVLNPEPSLMRERAGQSFNVFFVRNAHGSPFIPAQEGFVIPFGIKSVIGLGGLLPSGSLFAMILFLRLELSEETADLFKPLPLSMKLGVLEHDAGAPFA